MRSSILTLLLAVALVVPSLADGALPLETITKLTEHSWRGTFQLSPDEQWLAHTVEAADDISGGRDFSTTGVSLAEGRSRREALLTHLETGKTIKLGAAKASNWGPVWSPDGSKVAFYSDQGGAAGLWIWEKQSGEPYPIPGLIVRPFFGYEVVQWHHDSRRLVCKKNLDGQPLSGSLAKAEGPSVVVKIAGQGKETRNFRTSTICDLVLVDVVRRDYRVLAEKVEVRHYAFSPDSSFIAFAVLTGSLPNTQQNQFSMRVIDIETGRIRELSNSLSFAYGMEWSWSPSSEKIACITDSAIGGQLVVLSLDGEIFRASKANKPNLDWYDGEFTPKWDAEGKTVYATDGQKVWAFATDREHSRVIAEAKGWKLTGLVAPFAKPQRFGESQKAWLVGKREDKTRGFWSLDLETGELKLAKTFPRYISTVPFNLGYAFGTQQIIFFTEHQQSPGELWSFQTRTQQTRQLTHLNPELEKVPLGEARLIEWEFGGKTLRGSLLLPSDYDGERLPTVVWVYGGGYGSRHVDSFGVGGMGPTFNFHVLATRGYAIFAPDMPLREGHPLEDITGTALSGVDALVEQGYADPDRLAVMGQSYGAYSVLCLLTQTKRFKAAVATASVMHPDLIADYLQDPGYFEKGQGRMGGSIWEQKARYLANSPLFWFENVTTPLLIGQGELDSKEDAEATFTALERLGKAVELRIYADEGHVIQKPHNVIDFWQRRLEFLETHLTGA